MRGNLSQRREEGVLGPGKGTQWLSWTCTPVWRARGEDRNSPKDKDPAVVGFSEVAAHVHPLPCSPPRPRPEMPQLPRHRKIHRVTTLNKGPKVLQADPEPKLRPQQKTSCQAPGSPWYVIIVFHAARRPTSLPLSYGQLCRRDSGASEESGGRSDRGRGLRA